MGKTKRPLILAGDIGGTKTRLALFSKRNGRLETQAAAVFPSRRYAGLEPILSEFLKKNPCRVDGAAFGLAGAVSNGSVRATNLPWSVNTRSLVRLIASPRVGLINDMVAHAHGLAALRSSDLCALNPSARAAPGNRTLISPGTGLGVAHLYWDGFSHHPSPSEGGHMDFAPGTALQMELLEYLQTRFRHVSCERILCGPGLYNIYRFLKESRRGKEPLWLAEEMRRKDPSAVISEMALGRRSKLCKRALDLFVEICGAQAGNMALSVWATGGVYLGGGIALKILPALKEGGFLRAFRAKGRFSENLAQFPVKVILNDKTALWGAGLYALRHLPPQAP